jgi:acetyl/propionyl-CoA carboxylase alpha subunit
VKGVTVQSADMPKLKKLLVANRGEIACRVFRTAERLGLSTCAVYTAHDDGMPHMSNREAELIESYLDIDQVIAAAKKMGADSIHPGYGFLSENPAFARACETAGIAFIGPQPGAMEIVGDKSKARERASELGIPIAEGFGPFSDTSKVEEAARRLGAPLMLKAAAGGGGKGMKKLLSLTDLTEQVETSKRETKAAFGDDRLIVERYVYPARHIEVQVFGDGKRAIALGERECSLQRRHQKLIEESPSMAVDDPLRQRLFDSAVRLAESVGYRNAGTVEFLLGPDGNFFFLEVNARLQVEHPVTEMCTGLDLVEMQIEMASGEKLMKQDDVKREGHAIEARLNAEDPYNNFMPSAGKVLQVSWMTHSFNNANIRVDTGIGDHVVTEYDSLVAKIIAHGNDRETARAALSHALGGSVLLGFYSNQSYLRDIIRSDWFAAGDIHTATIDESEVGERPISELQKLAAAMALSGPSRKPMRPWDSQGWRLT